MRKNIFKILGAVLVGLAIFACKKSFLERRPESALDGTALANEKGVNTLIIAAYAALDGWADNAGSNAAGNPWPNAGSNWVWGSVSTDDAYPGSQPNDQIQIELINKYDWRPGDSYYRAKFQTLYWAIRRCNEALKVIAAVNDIPAATKTQLTGEAKFLRAHYYFDAYKMWKNIPWIDETTTEYRQPNTADVFPKIQADFTDAIAKLPESSSTSSARATKGAAQAYLARALMFVGKYAEAKPLLQTVIASTKYKLVDNFHDNFDAAKQNNTEMIFAYKATVNDGSAESANGNWGDRLNFPHGSSPVTSCCGFHQPAQNLVNAYKTDALGLPLFTTFNNTIYDPTVDNADPRLDWTAGRTGFPFLDWGIQQNSWVRDVGYSGNFIGKKNVFHKAQKGTLSTASGWSEAPNAIDIPFLRYSDVLLMEAECEIETNGNLVLANTYINDVRTRAGKFVQGPGTSEANISEALPAPVAGIVTATTSGTKYKIGLYPPFATQAEARNALRWERRLEFAMEGYRMFDLRRWGTLVATLNAYLTVEKTRRVALYDGGFPVTEKYNLYPLPTVEIELSKIDGVAQMKQNTGW